MTNDRFLKVQYAKQRHHDEEISETLNSWGLLKNNYLKSNY